MKKATEDYPASEDLSLRVQRNRLSSQVAAIIREQILTGQLLPGQRIVQAEWADRLGVSRMPVRDAINGLCLEGMLVQNSAGSAEVAPIDLEGLEDVFELNAITTALCARRAASRITPEEIAAAEDLNEEMGRAIGEGRLQDASELNWRFHRAVNIAARAPQLLALLRILARSTPHGSFEIIPEWPAQAYDDHKLILDALRVRDGERAASITRQHVLATAKPLLQRLAKRLSASRQPSSPIR